MGKLKEEISTKSQVITSSIPSELYDKIKDYAARHKMAKNKILEKALEFYFLEQKKKSFIEGVKKWGNDPENLVWAEMGMSDYSDQLKNMDA